jgi:4-hydroxy-3-methylbut-2-en-1-yl diphosphate synthase IspG/GcpE
MLSGEFIERKKTKKIKVGNVCIGGDAPITVQSMTNTDTRDVVSTIEQIKGLEEEGCDIVRVAVLDSEAANAIALIKKSIKIPLVADIHFDYRLAISAMENGADKIRLNPGNIGDTIRVSLTGAPKNEVRVGNSILKSLELKKGGIDFVSCPTCGRCRINLIDIANEVEKRLCNVDKNIKVAIMGCEVNGPGEAKEADIGIAGGKNEAVLFKKGKIIRKIPQEEIVDQLIEEIDKI